MATLDLTTTRQAVNMGEVDLVRFGSANLRFTSHWSWRTPDGHDLELFGSGLTFDANGRALSGIITFIEFDLGNDGFPAPDIVIRGINADAKLLDNSPDAFWSILSGDDTILGPLIANVGDRDQSTLFGDAIRAPSGAAAGGDDLFRAGDAELVAAGDVLSVGIELAGAPQSDYQGGNDRIFTAPTTEFQLIAGDAFEVFAAGKLIGGNDILINRSSSLIASASGDAHRVSGKSGDIAEVIGGNDKISAEDGFSGELAGDVVQVLGNARIEGGDDTIIGGDKSETIAGDVTVVFNASGVDVIGGNDTIDGGGAGDIIAGDLFVMHDAFTFTGGNDTIHGGDGGDQIVGELFSGDGASIGGNDQLFGDAGDDNLKGQSGNDILDGGADNDLLDGGGGNDTVIVSAGNDTAVGGAGIDMLNFSRARLSGIAVDLSSGSVALGDAAGGTLTFREFERVVGTAGADTITGDNLANALLQGAAGNDTINGRGGADTIAGGGGADLLTGGEGADRFDYNAATESGFAGAGRDAIRDFVAGADKIDVSAIDAIAGGGNDAFTFVGGAAFSAAGQVRAIQSRTHTVLEFNTDGVAGAEFSIVLSNFAAAALTQGDFIA